MEKSGLGAACGPPTQVSGVTHVNTTWLSLSSRCLRFLYVGALVGGPPLRLQQLPPSYLRFKCSRR